MKRSLTFVALVMVALNSMVLDAVACNGRGGGGFGFGYTPRYSSPVYRQPVYRQPVYRQPTQPVSVAPRQRIQQLPRQNFSQPQTSINQTQQPQQRIQNPQQQQVQSPQATQPKQVQRPKTQAPQSNQQSALALLAGRRASSTANTPAPQAVTPREDHVGRWIASLPNNTSVELRLEQDGRFSWIANKAGKVSQFDGSFSVDDGVLTLNRSNDGQKLVGTLNMNGGSAFNFKLNGANDSGLNFNRQS